MPELEVGFLVERFNQTPWMLGLCKGEDLGLLYRSLAAVSVYRTAQRYSAGDMKSLSDSDWEIVVRVRKELKKKQKQKRQKRRR